MMPPSELIYRLLLGNGMIFNTNVSWKGTIGFMPDTPDNAVTIYDTSGKFDGRLLRTGEMIEHPGIQIRIRALTSVLAWTKADQIAKYLDIQPWVTYDISPTDRYLVVNISRTSPIIPMGVEEVGERRRFNLTVNAIMTIKQLE